MAQTASNVTAAKPVVAGAIYVAPKGTTVPTDTTTTLGEAFKSLGYVSEDGLDNDQSIEVEDIKAWGGAKVLSIVNEKNNTYHFTLIESLNPEVLKTVYGSNNVTGTLSTGIGVTITDDDTEEFAWVVDMVMRGGVAKRIVVPDGKVTEIGTINYSDSAAVGYELTVTALNPLGTGYGYEYIKGESN